MSVHNNLRGLGMVKVPEGSYKNIWILGSLELYGGSAQRVYCKGSLSVLDTMTIHQRLTVSGEVDASAPLSVALMRVQGEGQFASLEAERLHLLGEETKNAKCLTGNIRAGQVLVKGTYRLERLKADTIRVKGRLICDGSICAEQIIAEGAVYAGEIEADRVQLAACMAQEIHAAVVSICPTGSGRKNRARVGHIEADEIQLQGMEVQSMCGQRVVIGPGCSIGTLEYSKSCTIHPTAQVEQIIDLREAGA